MSLEILDIRAHVLAMPERQSFLVEAENSLRPAFTEAAEKILLLMEWPLNGGQHLRVYAAIMAHGKMHVVETFFMAEEAEGGPRRYLGSQGTFSIRYPDHVYDAKFDDEIAEHLSRQLGLGVRA